ncbi:MAG TPA: hypothetical protein VOA88_05110 [Candidatus Dormibacteraeota bacterium]|nr:hypothetical protein [Candidatus Dormibacteraeota bacterium]
MDEEIQRRMDTALKKFRQPHAVLFPFIDAWVQTPLGEGKLLAVFADACEIQPSGTQANGKPKGTFRVPPEDIKPVSRAAAKGARR